MIDDVKELIAHLSPAAFGSAISIFTSKDEFTKTKLALTFIFGMSVAHYIGYGIVENFEIPLKSYKSSAIVFTVGFIGMQALKEFLIKLPIWMELVFKKVFGVDK